MYFNCFGNTNFIGHFPPPNLPFGGCCHMPNPFTPLFRTQSQNFGYNIFNGSIFRGGCYYTPQVSYANPFAMMPPPPPPLPLFNFIPNFNFNFNFNFMPNLFGNFSFPRFDFSRFTLPNFNLPQFNLSRIFSNALNNRYPVSNNNNSRSSQVFSNKAYYQQNFSAVSDRVRNYGANAKFIAKLHPAMQEKVMKLLDWAKSQGIKITITSGFRSSAQQKGLQWKNKGGKKIAAAVGTSPHEYGIAIDFRSSDNARVGKYARDVLGMRWGGDWGKGSWQRETWHIDMANTIKKVRA